MSGRVHVNATDAVHAGDHRTHPHHALTVPISATATYAFRDTAELLDHHHRRIEREEYGRYGNPTVRAAEERLAALDEGQEAACFSSGMAAITTTLFAMLQAGQHVVLTNDGYRRTRQFVTRFLARFGVEHTLVPPDDHAAIEAAIRPGQTRLIITESPTNPYLRVADLDALCAIRDRHRGVKLFVDSTFATPVNQRPLTFGADLVTHSCTKYLGGHNDLLGGVVIGRQGIIDAIRDVRGVLGGVMDPHAAYLLLRGLKTLHLRVQHQNASAMTIARALERDARVRRVYYPGLESHPDHHIATSQMGGFGGVVSFRLRTDLAGASRFIDACRIPRIAPSLGGVESLIEQPALMSFHELTTAERESIGMHDDLIRLAVGIEQADDLVADLLQALDALQADGFAAAE